MWFWKVLGFAKTLPQTVHLRSSKVGAGGGWDVEESSASDGGWRPDKRIKIVSTYIHTSYTLLYA